MTLLAADQQRMSGRPAVHPVPEVQIEPWCMKARRRHLAEGGVRVGSLLAAARTGITARSVGDLPSAFDVLVVGLFGHGNRELTELPQLSTVGILGRWSIDRPLVDLSTNRVAE
jgi:hypothetical protein